MQSSEETWLFIIWGKYTIRYKFRQFWLRVRFLLSGKNPILYSLRPGIRFIAFHDNANSKDIYAKKSYEDREIQWCINWLKNGDSFIDCGANIGYFSACLSQGRNLKKIVAVEGNSKCSEMCRATFDTLCLTNIDTVNNILHSNNMDELQIKDMPGEEGLQHAKKVAKGSGLTPTTTLDQLTKKKDLKPTLIKVDCEGAESEILKGSKELLNERRPAWIIEVNAISYGIYRH